MFPHLHVPRPRWMAADKLPKRLVERARHRCEYCLTAEWLTGQAGGRSYCSARTGGSSHIDNLCLACTACNGFKLDRTAALDAETNQIAPLFNPRTQRWTEHFMWSDDGTRIIGLTKHGRVTITTFKMNRPLVVAARAIWIEMQRHPPQDL
jgi:hypothetical protein